MKIPVIAAALAVMATAANAQPPPEGWIGEVSKPSILCDTSAQVQSIVDAFKLSPDQGKARFAELFETLNEYNEPTCAVTIVPIAEATGSIDLGKLNIDGTDVYGWIVHIRNGAGDGFYLHLETPAQVLANTI
jgi:hypothetical protein